jgi:putative peptide modification system cyclase
LPQRRGYDDDDEGQSLLPAADDPVRMTTDATDPSLPDSRTSSTRMRAVACLDLANSTALIEMLGDARAAELFRKHDRLARDLLREHGGREVDKTDGFLLLFDRAIDAVGFALDYQRALTDMGREGEQLLHARIGIHVGEVVLWQNADDDIARGAKPLEVEGLAKPIAARLSALAQPGQTLLSEHTYQLSRRTADELPDSARLHWLAHGRYRFKGVVEPMPVFEVGEAGVAPLCAPTSSAKAERELPLWRKKRSVFIESTLLLLAAIGVGYALLRESPAIAFAERDWVVVGNLANQTSETLFDNALDTALRIGLEQSRYVNVVPELQVEAALARMNLKGAGIDRRVGIELAVREGARAFLLPSIAEVGGRVRFSVEVIDPKSGATVYSESADGNGRDEVLPSMDRVVSRLRERLGESLDAVQENSAPLEQVTTGNLEALKAYSLAIKAFSTGDPRGAVMLFNRAVELDPDFSAAHAKLGGFYLYADEREKMRESFDRAYANRDRLSERERLYLEGLMASDRDPESVRDRWSQLAKIYPDFLVGQQNLATSYYWVLEYRYARALEHYQPLLESQHPLRGISMQNAAMAATGLGQFELAASLYDRAFAIGATNLADGRAGLYLAQRETDKAFEALSPDLSRDVSQTLLWKGLRRVAVLADQGRVDAALAALTDLRNNPTVGLRPNHAARLDLAQLAFDAEWRPDQLDAALIAFIEPRLTTLGENEIAFADTTPALTLVAAIIAARAERTAIAQRVRDSLAPRLRTPVVYERLALLDTLNRELARATDKDASASGDGVAQSLFDGRSLYLRDVAIARQALADRQPGARALLATQCEDRKLALAEWGNGFALLVPSIIASNRACLDAMRAAEAAGDEALAARMRGMLEKAWANADSDVRALIATAPVSPTE